MVFLALMMILLFGPIHVPPKLSTIDVHPLVLKNGLNGASVIATTTPKPDPTTITVVLAMVEHLVPLPVTTPQLKLVLLEPVKTVLDGVQNVTAQPIVLMHSFAP